MVLNGLQDLLVGCIISDTKKRFEKGAEYVRFMIGCDKDHKDPQPKECVDLELINEVKMALVNEGYKVKLGMDITNNHPVNSGLHYRENTKYEFLITKKKEG